MMKDNCLACNKRLYLSQKDDGTRKDITRICDECWEKGEPVLDCPAVKKDKKPSTRLDMEARQAKYCWQAQKNKLCGDIKCRNCLLDNDFTVIRGEHLGNAQKLRFEEWEEKK